MLNPPDQRLLDDLLDSWDRNNTILLNFLDAILNVGWHEGYHRGQMKLALKLAGCPMTDDEAGPLTWDLWMRKIVVDE